MLIPMSASKSDTRNISNAFNNAAIVMPFCQYKLKKVCLP